MPFIRTIPPEDASPELAREYEAAQRRAGCVAQILQLQSLNPAVQQAAEKPREPR